MSERRCGTCRHLGKADRDDEFRDCEKVKHDAYSRKGEEHHPAHVVDGSGHFAALRVTGEFGCVLHEEKIDG